MTVFHILSMLPTIADPKGACLKALISNGYINFNAWDEFVASYERRPSNPIYWLGCLYSGIILASYLYLGAYCLFVASTIGVLLALIMSARMYNFMSNEANRNRYGAVAYILDIKEEFSKITKEKKDGRT